MLRHGVGLGSGGRAAFLLSERSGGMSVEKGNLSSLTRWTVAG